MQLNKKIENHLPDFLTTLRIPIKRIWKWLCIFAKDEMKKVNEMLYFYGRHFIILFCYHSIQGIIYIFKTGQSIFGRLFWIFVVLLMLWLSCYMSWLVKHLIFNSTWGGVAISNSTDTNSKASETLQILISKMFNLVSHKLVTFPSLTNLFWYIQT
jgi:hypothetical protein